ncbi:MAG TPA: glycosyltransferase [Patescibacteria group bacterium]|nr:glycosyltransferase [Patescibacteria group bacterium]
MRDLSILIPARNEEFLENTIEDILKNIEADTEVIAVLDGQWANSPIEQHDRVSLIYVNPAIGQRAAQNLACRLSRAKYVMKLDAHCSFDKGFDRKMIEAFRKVDEKVVMLPVMRNLWAYDWKCYKCGKRVYQDREPKCPACGNKMKKKMLWIGKERPQSDSYCFDAQPTFAYFGEYRRRPEYKKDKKEKGLTEIMSIQGSCFMCLRQLYWDWNLCDETLGNWGHQGIEVACKTWLKGGRVLVNHQTWYAHMFRTKNATFSFPWPASGKDQHEVRKKVWEQILKGLPDQKHPVSWLVEKFWPVKGWTDEDLKKLKTKEAKLSSKHIATKPARKKSSLPSSGVIFSAQSTIQHLEIGLAHYRRPAQ